MEEGVSENSGVKVTSEVELDFTSNVDVTGVQIWKCYPFVLTGRVADPVSVLVDTGASRLEVSGLLLIRGRSFSLAFSDVVVFLGAVDFSPKTKFCGSGSLGQILK